MTEFIGCLSREEFNKCCWEILKKSQNLGDSFQVISDKKHSCNELFLVKNQVKPIQEHQLSTFHHIDNMTLEEAADEATVSSQQNGILKYEFHIVYSDSYNVPVCYFRVFKQDGTMLMLPEVWEQVPETHKYALKEKWSFITQQEHPYLMTPFFQLHPCHTNSMMKVLGGGSDRCENYVLLWLSAIKDIVNLDLMIDYFIVGHQTIS